MITKEWVEIASLCIGLTAAGFALYARATFSSFVLDKLNGRYLNVKVAGERFTRLENMITDTQKRMDNLAWPERNVGSAGASREE